MIGMIFVMAIIGFSMAGCDPDGGTDEFTVKFDKGDGGGNAPTDRTVQAGKKITLPGQGDMTAPTDKEFKGWESSGQSYNADAEYTVTADVTFIAQWETAESAALSITVTGLDSLNGGASISLYASDATPMISPKEAIADGEFDNGNVTFLLTESDGETNFIDEGNYIVWIDFFGEDGDADDKFFVYKGNAPVQNLEGMTLPQLMGLLPMLPKYVLSENNDPITRDDLLDITSILAGPGPEPVSITIAGLPAEYNGKIASMGLFKATGDIMAQSVIAEGGGLVSNGSVNIELESSEGELGANFQPPMNVYIGFQILGDDPDPSVTTDDEHYFYVASANFFKNVAWTTTQLSTIGDNLENDQHTVLQDILDDGKNVLTVQFIMMTKIIQELLPYSLSDTETNEALFEEFLFIPEPLTRSPF